MDIIYKDKEQGLRRRLELPCAEIVKRSPKKEQKSAVELVCNLLGIKDVSSSSSSSKHSSS